jgi:hypothetical protein
MNRFRQQAFDQNLNCVHDGDGKMVKKLALFSYQYVPVQDPLTVTIALFYANKGFMVEYYVDGKLEKNKIIACPSEGYIGFTFWPSSKVPSIPGEVFTSDEKFQWKTIEAAAGITVESFYRDYKESNPQKCIETFQKIWPLP